MAASRNCSRSEWLSQQMEASCTLRRAATRNGWPDAGRRLPLKEAASQRGCHFDWQPLNGWLDAGKRGCLSEGQPLRVVATSAGSHSEWLPLEVAASSTQPLKVAATMTGNHAERLPLELTDTRNGCLSKWQPLPSVQRVGTLDAGKRCCLSDRQLSEWQPLRLAAIRGGWLMQKAASLRGSLSTWQPLRLAASRSGCL